MGLRKKYLLLGLCLLPLSCTQEMLEGRTEILQAAVPVEAPVKADISADGAFTWAGGDEIAVWYESSQYQFSHYYNARLVSGAGSKDGTFRVEKNGERAGYAFYPIGIADNSYPGLGAHRLRLVLPDSYDIASGMPTPQPLLAGNTAGLPLTFYHLAAMLRLTITNIPAGTSFLRVSTDVDIAGPFRVTFPGGAGEHPYIETSESTDPGNHGSVTFTYAAPLAAAESQALDVPVPQGICSYVKVEALAEDGSSALSVASVAREMRCLRAEKQELAFDLSGGTSRLVSFSLSQVVSGLIPGQSVPVNAAVRQVRAGGGSELASGYTLEAAGVSDPSVAELFVRDNVIRVRALAPGKATIRIKAVKGDDSLFASTEVTVASIDGVSVCADGNKTFTDWYLSVPARVVSESRDVTSDELFSFEWKLLPEGTTLANLEGEGSTVILRTGPVPGSVTVHCTVTCKSDPSIVFSGQGDVSFEKAEGILKSPFSISATEQAYFGKANLLRDNGTGQLSFCPGQVYAYSGVEDLTLPLTSAPKRDMFNGEVGTWMSNIYTSAPIYVDGQPTDGWQLLSKAEYDYIFTSRTSAKGQASRIGRLANARYILAEVDGREGVIIFPDVFVWPEQLPAPSRVNAPVAPSTNKYTLAEWNKYLETAGAVFLVGGLFGPVSYGAVTSTFDYNYICYRSRDNNGYFWFPLYTGTKYYYNSTTGTGDSRYMRARPVKRIYK